MRKFESNTHFRNNLAKFIRQCRKKGQTRHNLMYSIQGFCAGWWAYSDVAEDIINRDLMISQVSLKDVK